MHLFSTDTCPEIRKHGDMTQIPRIKLVLLGEAGHGKTSLLRLLVGEEFVPEWNSTEGIECDLVSSRTLDRTSWKKCDVRNVSEVVADNVLQNLSNPDTLCFLPPCSGATWIISQKATVSCRLIDRYSILVQLPGRK